ncbi:MAG: hypothetical protein ABIP44_00985, partial [Pseudoxanthomonas sp.]
MKSRVIFCGLALLALVACKREAAANQTAAIPPVIAEPAQSAEAEAPASSSPTTAEIPALKVVTVEGKPYEL